MAVAIIVAIALLAKHSKSNPVPYPSIHRSCVELTLPVSVTAHNAVYDIVQVNNNIDAIAFGIDVDSWNYPGGPARVVQNITINETYDISAQLCIPPSGSKKDHLQIATHGLVFDKRYWDATINPSEYSYVDAALAAGYSILTYDRLGTGKSTKADAYKVVQAPLELEILREITEMARSGALLQHVANLPASKGVNFNKVIHLGHSFGSYLTSALLTTYGNLSDAAVITGFILNKEIASLKLTQINPEFAAQSDPKLFADRPSGYVVPGDVSGLQTGFFSTRQNATTGLGGFTSKALEYAYSVRQPATVGEWVSPPELNLGVALDFKGPVQYMEAEYDFLVCGGDCEGVYDPKVIHELFPVAKEVEINIQYGFGHALTLHRGANEYYKVTLDWLAKNGL